MPTIDEILSKNTLELINEYNGGSRSELIIRCKNCGKEFITCQFNLSQGYGKCPSCFPINQSKGERDIINFLKTFNIKNISTKNKFVIQPYELDIYLPTFNIAIEYNGLYWHSEEKINKNYHLNKTELCESKNIQLIHIFEDEWLFKKEIVKSRLKQILNLNSDLTKIYSEECEIKEISTEIKNEFLEKYHLQGFDSSNIKLGAFYNDELVSVMTFSKGNISKDSESNENIYELSRFCSNYNYHIVGIVSKLLSYFKNNFKWEEIYSYADRRWSKGNLYYKLGFELDNIIETNYWYTNGIYRTPNFNLHTKEGYYRIWDCGYYKFKLSNK